MADIVLRDRSGAQIQYPGVERLKLNTVDGGTQNFAAYDPDVLIPENLANGVTIGGVTGTMETPESVETEVALDFSGGDMEVTPEEGKTFSKVTIPTPDNLKPEHIAEGVDIAGIVGTLAAGGSCKAAFGTFAGSETTAVKTITHDLGAIPDLIIIYMITNMSVSGGNLWMEMIHLSTALQTALGAYRPVSWWGLYAKNSTYYKRHTSAASLDDNNTTYIHGVTETTFNLPAKMLDTNNSFAWIAISGLV